MTAVGEVMDSGAARSDRPMAIIGRPDAWKRGPVAPGSVGGEGFTETSGTSTLVPERAERHEQVVLIATAIMRLTEYMHISPLSRPSFLTQP